MVSSELAESPATAGREASLGAGLRMRRGRVALAVVAVATALGLALRLVVARQSIFADELSTYWISATHGLGGVLSLMYGTGRIAHAEISPPLPFLLSWLTTRAGHSPVLLRLPELVAGTATIPLVYVLGRRSVGRAAAVVAAALTALAPFMIYYSAEARAYGLMMFCVVVSTIAMLRALDTGRGRWWVLYAVAACAAFYSHYTCAFVLLVQFAWVVWAHPRARRPVTLASAGAAAGVLPWLPGLVNDFRSPTLKILSALSPFTLHAVRVDLTHWAIGYPYTEAGRLTGLPGRLALALLAVALVLGVAGLALAVAALAPGQRRRPLHTVTSIHDRRLVLIVALALATPAGEALVSATGHHIFGVRDLAASWPYMAAAAGAALTAWRPGLAIPAAGLAVVAFALGASRMLGGQFTRPDYRGAAAYIDGHARAGDVVVDETGALSPGPLTGLDVALRRRLPVFRAQAPAERDHPFGFSDPVVSLPRAIDRAVTAAHGHRLFMVLLVGGINPSVGRLPDGYRLQAQRRYSGIGGAVVKVYAPPGPAR